MLDLLIAVLFVIAVIGLIGFLFSIHWSLGLLLLIFLFFLKESY